MSDDEDVHTLEEIREALLAFPTSRLFPGMKGGMFGANIWRKNGKITLRVAGEGHAFNLSFPLDDLD